MASLSALYYRPHFENGLSVAAGVALAGTAAGLALGLAGGIAAATGALCVSIADQPDPIGDKPGLLAAALTMAVVATGLTLLAKASDTAMFVLTGAMGLWAGLISAYGKRAVGLGVVTVLAFVLTLGATIEGREAGEMHLLLFGAGGLIYLVYALVLAVLFDRRVRRLLMAEALRSFAGYLRAKAEIYDPGGGDTTAFAAVIERHAAAVERMQIARDAIYARTQRPWQLRQAQALVALLDSFETILSSDADIEILRGTRHRHLMRRLKALTLALAAKADALALSPTGIVPLSAEPELRDAIAEEVARLAKAATGDDDERLVVAALRSTADKLGRAAELVAAIGGEELGLPRADLSLFRQIAPRGLGHLRAQVGFGKPAFRYAIRLSLALCAGFGLSVAFPDFAHPGWILLTTALIMRANYSVTRRRRWDRIVGTLFGCVLAAGLQAFVPTGYLLALVALSTGVSHAFGAVNYRVTAASASVSSLLLLHFLQPHGHFEMFERIGDTLIGAALSYVFSFLLPSWERAELPRTIAGLLEADRAFAAEAMTRTRTELAYRLARKRLFDAIAALSGAVRRVADEPNTPAPLLERLNALTAANYLLLSDLTSMQVLFAMRGAELDLAPRADAMTDEMRNRVLEILSERGENRAPPRLTKKERDDLTKPNGYAVLKRRLVHIEHAARRVAALARESISG